MKLNSDFYAVLPGEIYPQTFAAGTDCPPALVEVAQSLGLVEQKAVKKAPANKAIKHAPENKALTGAPENKGQM